MKLSPRIKSKKFIISATVILAIAIYFIFSRFNSTAAETRYFLSAVTKGSIISTISGTGQVSSSNQIDLNPKVSGDVLTVAVVAGQEVKQAQLIVQLDAGEALKTMRDAEINLTSAKLSMEKLQQPADALSITQAENNLIRATESKVSAEEDLTKAYEDGYSAVADAYLDLADIMTGLNTVLNGNNIVTNQSNRDYYSDAAGLYDSRADQYSDDAYNKYQAARINYDSAFSEYKAATRYSDTETIEKMINSSYAATKKISEAIKSANNLIQFYKDTYSTYGQRTVVLADTHLTSLNSYTGKANSHLSSLSASQNTIKLAKETIVNAERSIDENTASLDKLKAGTDELDLRSAQLTLQQRQNSLADAKEKLADYYLRAPFDGVIAAINVKKSDAVSTGTALATIITRQKIAEISLNEVDAAKIKVGQKTTLTFDAIEDLTISGQVAEIDAIGTVNQGVVSYNVSINFDTQDDRVKPGMSVSAAIITDMKQDVLIVPNEAIKSQGSSYYVEMPSQPLAEIDSNQSVSISGSLKQQQIEIGLADDTSTEIVSGLVAGDQIIVRSVSATAKSGSTSSQTPSLFGGSSGPQGMPR